MKNMNDLVDLNSFLTVLNMFWIDSLIVIKTHQITDSKMSLIDSHFTLNTLQIITMKCNILITSHYTIWLIISGNLITLSTHQIIIKTSHILNTETKFYCYLIRFISLNQIRHMSQKTKMMMSKISHHIMSKSSSTIHHSLNTTIHSTHVIHAKWLSKTVKLFKITFIIDIKLTHNSALLERLVMRLII